MCKINKFIMWNLTFCASTKRDQLYLTHFFAFSVSNFPVQVSINQLEKENKYLSMITVSVAIEYRKIPKGIPGAYIFQRPLLRGLLLSSITDLWGDICVSKSIGLALWLEGNLPFLLFFYFVFEGNFQVHAPGGLIFGGANTRRGLFSEFYGTLEVVVRNNLHR